MHHLCGQNCCVDLALLTITSTLLSCPAGRDDFGLQNINIGIDMGSRIAIAGPNGAGKTTLMNLLSGAAHPPQPSTANQHSTAHSCFL
jgi:ATPase subunit of ABC transporter with duplicated ATPase domains